MQAPARHMVPAVNLLKAPPGAPDHMSDLNQVVGDPAKSESHILWSKRSAESPVHGGSSSSSSNSLGPACIHGHGMGLAHGPLACKHGSCTWAPGLGPAQGPWARVLHKDPWRRSILARVQACKRCIWCVWWICITWSSCMRSALISSRLDRRL